MTFITTAMFASMMFLQASAAPPEGLDTMDEPTGSQRLKLRKGITIDSGAASNVMPRRMVRRKDRIRPSPSSLKGVHYVAANNGRIPNEGEVDFEFITPGGHQEKMVFQIAEVNKALGSVSYLVDNGYRVAFDKDAATGKDLSFMIHKPSGRTTRFRRDRNVWVLDAIVESSGFGRQA